MSLFCLASAARQHSESSIDARISTPFIVQRSSGSARLSGAAARRRTSCKAADAERFGRVTRAAHSGDSCAADESSVDSAAASVTRCLPRPLRGWSQRGGSAGSADAGRFPEQSSGLVSLQLVRWSVPERVLRRTAASWPLLFLLHMPDRLEACGQHCTVNSSSHTSCSPTSPLK